VRLHGCMAGTASQWLNRYTLCVGHICMTAKLVGVHITLAAHACSICCACRCLFPLFTTTLAAGCRCAL